MKLEEFIKLDINEMYDYVYNNIKYGWIDTKGNTYTGPNNDDLEYSLQTPQETLERKIAICFDKCELLRYYFESNGYKVDTYFIYLYIRDDYCPAHSILVYHDNNELIWIQPSRDTEIMKGIHRYKSEDAFLIDLKNKFIDNGLKYNFFTDENDLINLNCYKFEKPSFGIRGSEYYNNSRKGIKYDI